MSESEIQDMRAALLARLRFERGLGLETLRPIPLETRTGSEAADREAMAAAVPEDAGPELAPPATELDASTADKPARWAQLEARVLACSQCILHKGRTKVVFGEGDREARVVFVGEGPGMDEDRSGRPFVGPAGQLLNKIIGAVGWKREDVYICNIVKCRPPNNRTPLPNEVEHCIPYLHAQIELIQPKAIVALGKPATHALLNTTDSISSLRGRWRLYRQIRVMPTFHPAYILRQYTPEVRGAVWDDMKQVKAYLDQI